VAGGTPRGEGTSRPRHRPFQLRRGHACWSAGGFRRHIHLASLPGVGPAAGTLVDGGWDGRLPAVEDPARASCVFCGIASAQAFRRERVLAQSAARRVYRARLGPKGHRRLKELQFGASARSRSTPSSARRTSRPASAAHSPLRASFATAKACTCACTSRRVHRRRALSAAHRARASLATGCATSPDRCWPCSCTAPLRVCTGTSAGHLIVRPGGELIVVDFGSARSSPARAPNAPRWSARSDTCRPSSSEARWMRPATCIALGATLLHAATAAALRPAHERHGGCGAPDTPCAS